MLEYQIKVWHDGVLVGKTKRVGFPSLDRIEERVKLSTLGIKDKVIRKVKKIEAGK